MINLTREEAQQVLDAFLGIGQRAYDAMSGDAFHECSIAVSRLRFRLAQPDGKCNGMPAYEGSLSAGQRLAQPEPEPVASAWAEGYKAGIEDERSSEANIGIAGFGAKVEPARQNPYTAPPQRKWQGLTDEEIKAMWNEWKDALCLDHKTWAQAIEAKLKEKNT